MLLKRVQKSESNISNIGIFKQKILKNLVNFLILNQKNNEYNNQHSSRMKMQHNWLMQWPVTPKSAGSNPVVFYLKEDGNRKKYKNIHFLLKIILQNDINYLNKPKKLAF